MGNFARKRHVTPRIAAAVDTRLTKPVSTEPTDATTNEQLRQPECRKYAALTGSSAVAECAEQSPALENESQASQAGQLEPSPTDGQQ